MAYGGYPLVFCHARKRTMRSEPLGTPSNCVRTCRSNSKYAPEAQHGWTIKWWATRKNCRHSVQLASGRFAMLDDGMGFSLVPWRPVVEQRLGQQVAAVVRGSSVTWDMGR